MKEEGGGGGREEATVKTESGPEPARVVAEKNAERRCGPKGRGGQQKAGVGCSPALLGMFRH